MSNYEFEYSDQSVYGKIFLLMKRLKLAEGIHLDLGCGHAAIMEKSAELGLTYLGIDKNESAISHLKKLGIEACQLELSNSDDAFQVIMSAVNGRKISLITAIDVIEHLVNTEKFLSLVNRLSVQFNAPFIISVPNISHRDVAFKLFSGTFDYTETGLLDQTHVKFLTEKHLVETFKICGFEQIEKNDFELVCSDQLFPKDNITLASGTLVNQYLNWLKQKLDPNATINQFVRAFVPVQKPVPLEVSKKSQQNPFLSIVIRTQGRRKEGLRELLLCLSAQTVIDFEVVIVMHNISIAGETVVSNLIEETPNWFKEKVKKLSCNWGNRTAPLNYGFENATGDYISVVDDDDIVFDHWVETFKKLAQSNYGSVLHSYCALQDWILINAGDENEFLRAIGTPDSIYCTEYDWIEQLNRNLCPLMSLAFPSFLFKNQNIKFDETLTTTEDWDYLLRSTQLCGIVDAPEVTSIYRKWVNFENSNTLHDQEEWQLNHKRIQEKMAASPFLLPIGSTEKIIKKLTYDHLHASDAITKLFCTLYVDDGNGYSEESSLHKDFTSHDFCFEFDDFSSFDKIQASRFDPCEKKGILVDHFQIEIQNAKDEKIYLNAEDIESTGLLIDKKLAFLKNDPQINIPISKIADIKKIIITGMLEFIIPDEILEVIIEKNRAYSQMENEAMQKSRKASKSLSFKEKFARHFTKG